MLWYFYFLLFFAPPPPRFLLSFFFLFFIPQNSAVPFWSVLSFRPNFRKRKSSRLNFRIRENGARAIQNVAVYVYYAYKLEICLRSRATRDRKIPSSDSLFLFNFPFSKSLFDPRRRWTKISAPVCGTSISRRARFVSYYLPVGENLTKT